MKKIASIILAVCVVFFTGCDSGSDSHSGIGSFSVTDYNGTPVYNDVPLYETRYYYHETSDHTYITIYGDGDNYVEFTLEGQGLPYTETTYTCGDDLSFVDVEVGSFGASMHHVGSVTIRGDGGNKYTFTFSVEVFDWDSLSTDPLTLEGSYTGSF